MTDAVLSRLPERVAQDAPMVLVIEDEAEIANIVVAYLERDGLGSHHASDGLAGLEAFQTLKPDLVLLDVKLPGIDGMDLLRSIRAHSDTPVIMLTAFADDIDKLLGLRLGADDYVTKPFSPPELVARVRAVLRRTGAAFRPPAAAIEVLRVGPVTVDMQAHAASVLDADGTARPLPLTLTEFRLLAFLAARPRQCFSRQQLLEACLPESDALERVVDSHLSKLRRKLGEAGHGELIETVRGIGYRLWPGS